MDIYNADDVKAVADIGAFIGEHITLKRKGGKMVGLCPFHDEKTSSFTVYDDHYHCFGCKETGDIIAFAEKYLKLNFLEALDAVGKRFNAKKQPVKTKVRIDEIYSYSDLQGKTIHQTVRYEPKDFRQRRPDPDKPGKWIWSLDGIETILYRLSSWEHKKYVYICEGEKDADALLKLGVLATTAAQGLKWRPYYLDSLKGKKVVLLPDNDDAGKLAAKVWAKHLVQHCEVRIIVLSTKKKGDVSDWLAAGTKDGLFKLTATYPPIKAEDVSNINERVEAAKLANKVGFANYMTVFEEGKKPRKEPRLISEMFTDVSRRLLGFPRRVGATLFDLDRDTGEIRYLCNNESLCAWLSEKTGHNVAWAGGEGFVSRKEFFEGLKATASAYNSISESPSWPARTDVFYAYGEKFPDPHPHHAHLEKLADFLLPHAAVDKPLMKVFIASPLYHIHGIERPLWVIDSPDGQGAGKSTLVQLVAKLYGGRDLVAGEVVSLSLKRLKEDPERLFKRLLARSGRKKKIVCIDNADGYVASDDLATLITSPAITGMSPYGRDEETRINDLMYVITGNKVVLNKDLNDRPVILYVAKPDRYNNMWKDEVMRYIEKMRMHIIADVIDILKKGKDLPAIESCSRFPRWERDVFRPFFPHDGDYKEAWEQIEYRKDGAGGEDEEADIVREVFNRNLINSGHLPQGKFFIRSEIVRDWAQEALPRSTTHAALRRVRQWAQCGLFPEFSEHVRIYPHNGPDRRRGLCWNWNSSNAPPTLLAYNSEKKVVVRL